MTHLTLQLWDKVLSAGKPSLGSDLVSWLQTSTPHLLAGSIHEAPWSSSQHWGLQADGQKSCGMGNMCFRAQHPQLRFPRCSVSRVCLRLLTSHLPATCSYNPEHPWERQGDLTAPDLVLTFSPLSLQEVNFGPLCSSFRGESWLLCVYESMQGPEGLHKSSQGSGRSFGWGVEGVGGTALDGTFVN